MNSVVQIIFHKIANEAMASVEVSASFAAKELGYDQLKELQMRVIKPFVAGKDVFAVLMKKACAMPA